MSVSDLQSQVKRRRYKPRFKRHQRGGFNNDGAGSKSESDVDIEQSRDSGYDSNLDDEAEYLNGLIEKFEEEGPQISNLGDVAKEMIQREHRMWLK
jgi:hypothetical protein